MMGCFNHLKITVEMLATIIMSAKSVIIVGIPILSPKTQNQHKNKLF